MGFFKFLSNCFCWGSKCVADGENERYGCDVSDDEEYNHRTLTYFDFYLSLETLVEEDEEEVDEVNVCGVPGDARDESQDLLDVPQDPLDVPLPPTKTFIPRTLRYFQYSMNLETIEEEDEEEDE